MSACLSITTLGDLTFQQNGETITSFPSRKAEALLVYLAIEKESSHRRESLFTLLWPGMPEKFCPPQPAAGAVCLASDIRRSRCYR